MIILSRRVFVKPTSLGRREVSAVLHVPTVKRLGRHVIAEFWDIEPHVLCSVGLLESIFVDACKASGATVLHSNFHGFGDGCGVTGVVILSESHASVHTWPEYGYAAVDVFMCGSCDPNVAVKAIENRLAEASAKYIIGSESHTFHRGILESH